MYVPLSFLALGACSGRKARRAWWLAIPGILAVGLVLSLAMEFAQVLTSHRIPSIHDVIAQSVGGVIGLGLWISLGPPVAALAARAARKYRARSFLDRILYVYTVLLVVYQLLPLDITLSVAKISKDYRKGRIRPVPFSDLSELALIPAVMEAAMYLPVGFLLAQVARRARHPLVVVTAGSVVFACAVEAAQLFVRSQPVSGTQALFGAAAACLGSLLAGLFGRKGRGD